MMEYRSWRRRLSSIRANLYPLTFRYFISCLEVSMSRIFTLSGPVYSTIVAYRLRFARINLKFSKRATVV